MLSTSPELRRTFMELTKNLVLIRLRHSDVRRRFVVHMYQCKNRRYDPVDHWRSSFTSQKLRVCVELLLSIIKMNIPNEYISNAEDIADQVLIVDLH
jgi:hypothetical protein